MSEQKESVHSVYQDLNEIADQNNISTEGEKAISKVIAGHDWHWHQIPQAYAVEVLSEIELHGIGKVQNWGLSGKRPSEDPHLETVTDDSSLHSNAEIFQITDKKSGELVNITQRDRDQALQAHGQIEGAFWQIANALHRIVEERLYLALDYTSFEAYCADTLPWKARQAYDYALAGGEFGRKLLGDGEKHERADNIESMGISKIKLLASKASDQVDRLIQEGKIMIGEDELTDEQIADMRVKDLRQQLKEADEKAARAELLEEQKKNLEMQNESLAEEKEDLAGWKETHRERAETQDDIAAIIERCYQLAKDMNASLMELKLQDMMEVASEDQRQELVTLLDMLGDRINGQRKRFSVVIEEIYDKQMDDFDEAAIDNIIGN